MNTYPNRTNNAVYTATYPRTATSEYRLCQMVEQMRDINRMSKTISRRMSQALAGLARLLED